jgi:mannose-6-phosphate isomerase-like protein (cupin superfamily)
MAAGKVVNKTNVRQYKWGADCESWVLSEMPGLSVKQERMRAGTKEQLHYHQYATQFFFVLKGIATFYVEDEKIILNEQDGLTIKSTMKHFVINESDETIEFLVVSQPDTSNDRINIEME